MTFNKISLFVFCFLLFTIPCYSQNPCRTQEILPSCQPVEGTCPTGYAFMNVGAGVCVRPQAEPATVAVKTSLESPATSPQMALNETLEVKKPRMYRKEKKTFLASKKAIYGSDILYWSGVAFDAWTTTRKNGYESNSFLQDRNGRLNVKKYYGIHGGLWVGLKLLEKVFPELATFTKGLFGSVHIVAGFNNLRKTP